MSSIPTFQTQIIVVAPALLVRLVGDVVLLYGETQLTLTTVESLAEMSQRPMASKKDVKEFHAAVNRKFELVKSRLGRIKHLLLEEQKREIKSLEARIKKSKTPSPFSKSVDRPATYTSSRHRMVAFACLSSSPIRRITPQLSGPREAEAAAVRRADERRLFSSTTSLVKGTGAECCWCPGNTLTHADAGVYPTTSGGCIRLGRM